LSRRIPLPRLTQRQRTARWQRERRQQAILVTVFSVLLFTALGLMAWAGTTRYYTANLRPAASVDGRVIPYRAYNRELGYELVKFYLDAGVPAGFENDSRIASQKAQYDRIALTSVIEQDLLDGAARAEGFDVAPAEIDQRYTSDFSEFRSRHILIEIDKTATDQAAADKAALAKAETRPTKPPLRRPRPSPGTCGPRRTIRSCGTSSRRRTRPIQAQRTKAASSASSGRADS